LLILYSLLSFDISKLNIYYAPNLSVKQKSSLFQSSKYSQLHNNFDKKKKKKKKNSKVSQEPIILSFNDFNQPLYKQFNLLAKFSIKFAVELSSA